MKVPKYIDIIIERACNHFAKGFEFIDKVGIWAGKRNFINYQGFDPEFLALEDWIKGQLMDYLESKESK